MCSKSLSLKCTNTPNYLRGNNPRHAYTLADKLKTHECQVLLNHWVNRDGLQDKYNDGALYQRWVSTKNQKIYSKQLFSLKAIEQAQNAGKKIASSTKNLA